MQEAKRAAAAFVDIAASIVDQLSKGKALPNGATRKELRKDMNSILQRADSILVLSALGADRKVYYKGPAWLDLLRRLQTSAQTFDLVTQH